MRHGSLFSGIRGFELAAKWMGWENVFSCEIDEFCNKVGKFHFPDTIIYNDIKQTDFTIHRGSIDILTGGFPCQPYSQAGDRKGKEDDRHLWPENLRAVREIKPAWVVGENVRGLVNWNGGMVFDEVQSDLEAEGYEVQPFLLPIGGVGSFQERYRIFFIAYSDSIGRQRRKERFNEKGGKRENSSEIMSQGCSERDTWFKYRSGADAVVECYNDGLPEKLDGITIPRWKRESLKAFGNAVSPHLVLQIFKSIDQYEKLIPCTIQ